MLLTIEELKELTGAVRKREMIEWLKRERFTFRVRLTGWPAVHHDHVAEMLGAAPKRSSQSADVRLDHLPGAKHGKKEKEPARPA